MTMLDIRRVLQDVILPISVLLLLFCSLYRSSKGPQVLLIRLPALEVQRR